MTLYTKIFIKFPCRFWTKNFYILMYEKTKSTRFKYWQHILNPNEFICPEFKNKTEYLNFNYSDFDSNNFSLFLTTLVIY